MRTRKRKILYDFKVSKAFLEACDEKRELQENIGKLDQAVPKRLVKNTARSVNLKQQSVSKK